MNNIARSGINYLFRKTYYIFNKKTFGSIGKNSVIIKPFLIYNKKHIFLGKNVMIRDFARIEPIKNWGDQVFDPHIIIGDNVSIEQGLHLTCINKVIIEEGCNLTSYCVITDIDHEYRDINKRILDQPLIQNETRIEKDSFIGSGAVIMPGVTIGEHGIIGANAVVTRNIPPFCVVAGVPAQIIKRYNFEKNRWEKTTPDGAFLI
jgi:acetyltransferase-like isoleucine patch superfamily enzyme